jgi:nitrogen fixation NifU-like protein
MEHYRHPHNRGALPEATFIGSGKNANCGDNLIFSVKLDAEGKIIEEAKFQGDGCAISLAGASLFTEKLKGMKFSEAKLLAPGVMYSLLGVPISHTRTRCALLPYEALSDGITKYGK